MGRASRVSCPPSRRAVPLRENRRDADFGARDACAPHSPWDDCETFHNPGLTLPPTLVTVRIPADDTGDCTRLLHPGGWRPAGNGIAAAGDIMILTPALPLAAAAEHAASPFSGLPPQALRLFDLGPVPVTNSMIVSWAVTILLIVAVRIGTRHMQRVPAGFQNFFEWVVESLYGLLEMFLGNHWTKKTFWFFATVFIYILAANWIGLLPGFMSIGWGHEQDGHFVLTTPLFRGVNADLNSTFAMAITFFAIWIVWSLRANGIGGFLHHIFGVKGGFKGFALFALFPVFLFAGLVEAISILIRPISLSFRLYGNIFGGENLLEQMYHMAGYLVPIPFMLLETLVGFVQALVFMLLTTVFTMTMCVHEEEEAH